MPVKGRQGLLINQKLRFGPYLGGPVHRGWTSSYDIPFLLRFQGSKEKLSFTQFGEEQLKAEVFCIGKLRSTEFEVVKDVFGIPIRYENTFSGSIVLDAQNAWNFIVYNPDYGYGKDQYSSGGFIQNKTGKRYDLKAIKKLDVKRSLSGFDNYGFEIYLDGRALAAVSTLNNGKVWLRKDLDAEQKILLSSVCSALLLRSSLGEDFKSDYSNP